MQEWQLFDQITKNEKACTKNLFHSCDVKHDNFLTPNELCRCFSSIQMRCNYIHNPKNLVKSQKYMEKIQQDLNHFNHEKVAININNYVPSCDVNGYFLKQQCNKEVTCWCVDKSGLLNKRSLNFINNYSPINCD